MYQSARKLSALALAAATFALTACSSDDNPTENTVPPVLGVQAAPNPAARTSGGAGSGGNVDVTQDISANTTWTADRTYTLKGFIHVLNGATLTIQPGTKIMGDFTTVGSSLFILRGAKINAVGTADNPIVFTSSRPAGQRQPGDWGGLIIVGNAKINRSGAV